MLAAVATEADPGCMHAAAACAIDATRWSEGKRLFNQVRAERLLVLNTPAESVFALAEAACAVAYTAGR